MRDSATIILWGCEAIAAEIGQTVAATFYMLEKGHLPARKVGRRWAVDREELRCFFRGTAVTTPPVEGRE